MIPPIYVVSHTHGFKIDAKSPALGAIGFETAGGDLFEARSTPGGAPNLTPAELGIVPSSAPIAPAGTPPSGELASPISAEGDANAGALDGRLMGAGTAHFGLWTGLANVPPVLPAGGVRIGGTLVFVNGITNTPVDHWTHLQNIADRTGQATIGVYNATEGAAVDLMQAVFDKLERWHYEPGRNPAVDSIGSCIYEAAKANRPLHLLAHSQGGLVVSLAVEVARRKLQDGDRLSSEAVLELLSNIRIETFGSAAHYYPDGPKYVHYMNRFDSVASAVGFLWLDVAPLRIVHPGSGAVSHQFMEFHLSFSARHSLKDVYLPRRIPFDEARSNDRGAAHPDMTDFLRHTPESQ